MIESGMNLTPHNYVFMTIYNAASFLNLGQLLRKLYAVSFAYVLACVDITPYRHIIIIGANHFLLPPAIDLLTAQDFTKFLNRGCETTGHLYSRSYVVT